MKTLSWVPKHVIALVGNNNTGKTHTLGKLVETLNWDNPNTVVKQRNNPSDCRVAGDYRGRRIGISTGGDDADTIIRSFIFFFREKCDIVIMATHPQSGARSINISWVALEEIVIGNGIVFHTVDKVEPTDEDSDRVLTSIRSIVDDIIDTFPEGN